MHDHDSQEKASVQGVPSTHSAIAVPRPPWWRRRYLVNRDLQLRFAWSAVLVGLVSSSLSSFMILLSFWSFNIWQGQRLPLPVMLTILGVMVINVTGIYIVAVLTTQRIVGPLFNLLRQFQEIAQFNFRARARFRRRDELQYVARRFNDMAIRLEERERHIYSSLLALQSLVAQNLASAKGADASGGVGHEAWVHLKHEIDAMLGNSLFASARAAASEPQSSHGS